MDALTNFVDTLSGIIWGPYVIIPLLLGTGLYLMAGMRFLPLFKIWPALKVMWAGRKPKEGSEGELTPWKAQMASMAAVLGTGNIVGVATAIFYGGPGAIFWMWLTGVLGMATKFAEATLAVHYREKAADGSFVGGPMYYIKNGLGEKWKWLAGAFAVFAAIACFGIGNMTQANAITANVCNMLPIPEWSVAVFLFGMTLLVLVGGVKRIGDVAGHVIPWMAMFYVGGCLLIIFLNIEQVPAAFGEIFHSAFNGRAAEGGFVGATIAMAIRFGVARGLFSNEAGLGSSPMAHATAQVKHPVKQGMIGMVDPFIDTIIINTMTALVILISGHWLMANESPAIMVAQAFGESLPFGIGAWLVTISILFFAWTTILGWALYGERSITYLFGRSWAKPFYIVFSCVVPIGCLMKITFVWNFSDLANGLMALPNLIALLLLSPVVFKLIKEFFSDPKNMED